MEGRGWILGGLLTYDKKGGILEGGVDYGRVAYICLKGGVYSGREGRF